MTTTDRPVLHLPARDIPVPASVSPEAQAILALGPLSPATQWPPVDDHEAWRTLLAAQESVALEMIGQIGAAILGSQPPPLSVDRIEFDGFGAYVIVPASVAPDDNRAYLDIHGGAWVQGGGEVCKATAPIMASVAGVRTWSVDYRMPPSYPFPVPLDDCLTVYRELLADHAPSQIIVGGASAGGNLAAALLLKARDEGLPMPAAVILDTPGTDLTLAGDSWQTNADLDSGLNGDLEPPVLLYAAGHDRRDPYISPLFGDLRGFPPAILLTGTRDRLLSDTVRLHRALRAADVPADLHVYEAAGHGKFLGTAPEDRDHDREIRRFIDAHCPPPAQ